ncbi:FAD-dependent oxidoreductase [Streptomyces sp. NPDC057428]|uniref:FAD-dependent oxidoreductase n=1 Tax=Streptomyces sp. NPDC057428 TaxID=3346129 RepID=UPI003693C725
MAESHVAVFDRLVRQDVPKSTPALFETACVLGGSIAGLLAACVLADHSREVLVIEREEVILTGQPRAGVPHDRQAHILMPGGLALMERRLPGITGEMRDAGAVLLAPDEMDTYIDGVEQLRTGDAQMLFCSRPFLESALRRRVLDLPNVSADTARVTGFVYREGAVSAVRYVQDDTEDILPVDFTVDAMGRSSKLSDWLEEEGFSRPHQQRMQTGIHYSTAVVERVGSDVDRRFTACQYPLFAGPGGLAAGLVVKVENDRWMVSLLVHGGEQASRVDRGIPRALRQASAGVQQGLRR